MLRKFILFFILCFASSVYGQNNGQLNQQIPMANGLNLNYISPRVPVIWYTSDDKRFSWDISLQMIEFDRFNNRGQISNNDLNLDRNGREPQYSFNLKFSF